MTPAGFLDIGYQPVSSLEDKESTKGQELEDSWKTLCVSAENLYSCSGCPMSCLGQRGQAGSPSLGKGGRDV